MKNLRDHLKTITVYLKVFPESWMTPLNIWIEENDNKVFNPFLKLWLYFLIQVALSNLLLLMFLLN